MTQFRARVLASDPIPIGGAGVWVQTRGPRSDNDGGAIIEAQYAVAGGVLYLEDMRGSAIASQKLRDDDTALHVAARLLRDHYRGRNNAPAGFYEADINRKITVH